MRRWGRTIARFAVSPCGRAGSAWLQFEVTPAHGGSLIRQTALFDPVGVRGLLYSYGLWGIHRMVLAGMLRNIVRAATPASDRA
jgi:hypothetical protein